MINGHLEVNQAPYEFCSKRSNCAKFRAKATWSDLFGNGIFSLGLVFPFGKCQWFPLGMQLGINIINLRKSRMVFNNLMNEQLTK